MNDLIPFASTLGAFCVALTGPSVVKALRFEAAAASAGKVILFAAGVALCTLAAVLR